MEGNLPDFGMHADPTEDEKWLDQRSVSGGNCFCDSIIDFKILHKSFSMNSLIFPQVLLRSSSTAKVLLITYEGEGSELLYEVFKRDTDAVAWRDPLRRLYQHLYGVWTEDPSWRAELMKSQMHK